MSDFPKVWQRQELNPHLSEPPKPMVFPLETMTVAITMDIASRQQVKLGRAFAHLGQALNSSLLPAGFEICIYKMHECV